MMIPNLTCFGYNIIILLVELVEEWLLCVRTYTSSYCTYQGGRRESQESLDGEPGEPGERREPVITVICNFLL